MARRVISVGVAIALIAALALAAATPQMPTFAEARARWRPSEARLLDHNGDPVHELRIDPHGRRFAWTPLDQISPALI
ncbi:MAG TPA: penicillin-binding protein 1C, partial [Patescibacteria group bacterium]|nr:penicillin-binding protein 1C [Patescibacteria group bacterium]